VAHAASIALGAALIFVACGGRSLSRDADGEGGSSGEPSIGGSGGGAGSSEDAGGATTGGATMGGATTGGVGFGGSGARGGAVESGAGGTAGIRLECKSIGTRCPEGATCASLVCGLADAGSRSCTCMSNAWSCTPCDFTGSWLETFHEVDDCPPDVADEVPCTAEHVLCGPLTNGEVCACWNSPSDGQSWDCDEAPPTWGL
jgi:hypothetical protein